MVLPPHLQLGCCSRVPDSATILRPFQGLTEDEKRFRLAMRLEQLRRQAPTSLRAHAQFCHRIETDTGDAPMVAARHHATIVEKLEDPDENFVCFVMPPGYGKSTWGVSYLSWEIGRSKARKRIGLVANTDRLAWSWAGAIKETVESDAFRAAYPEIVPDTARGWRHNELFFKASNEVSSSRRAVAGTPKGPNASLYAVGMNGPVQSKRFDIIYLDDPTTWQDALSPAVLDKQRQWAKNTLIRRFPPGGRPPQGRGTRMVVTLTRWTAEDLVPLLEEQGFTIVHMPALGEDIDPVTKEPRPGLHALWPEKESVAELLKRQEDDPTDFALVDQGDTAAVKGDVFDDAWFKLREPLLRTEYDRVVMGVDTSSGKKRQSGDYSAWVVLGRRPDGSVDVLYVKRERATTPEQEEETIALMGYWEPDLTVIEDRGEGTALIQRLVSRHIGRAIKPVVPVVDKESRATGVSLAYRNGHVFHAGHPGGDDLLRGEAWLRQFVNEMKAFPTGRHDDQVDALAHAYNDIGGAGPRVRVL